NDRTRAAVYEVIYIVTRLYLTAPKVGEVGSPTGEIGQAELRSWLAPLFRNNHPLISNPQTLRILEHHGWRFPVATRLHAIDRRTVAQRIIGPVVAQVVRREMIDAELLS